ncbi:MAG TPA: hypothetical protein VFW11_00570 [Cyclobacteriaceae bacterium]|nr:hypothetical protein [Cyclobacteriaceae bacterium]
MEEVGVPKTERHSGLAAFYLHLDLARLIEIHHETPRNLITLIVPGLNPHRIGENSFNAAFHDKEIRNLSLVDLIPGLKLKEDAARRDGTVNEDVRNWIEWARKKADWYDPNIEQEDELLGIVDKSALSFRA